MKNSTKSRVWQLILVLLPIPLTALITLWIANRPDNITYLDYAIRTESSGFPEEIKGKVDITYEGVPVDDLSAIRFYIYNSSNRNLSKVQLHFEIQDESKKYTLVGSSLSGPEAYPKNGVHLIQSNNPNIYVYSIDSINRSDSDTNYTEFFVADFVFVGKELPNIEISTSNTGVKLRNTDETSVTENMNVFELISYFIRRNRQELFFMVSIYVPIILMMIYYVYAENVARFHFRNAPRQNLEALSNIKLSKDKIEDIVKLVNKLYRDYMWGQELIIGPIRALIMGEKITD